MKQFTFLLLQANHLSYVGQSGHWKNFCLSPFSDTGQPNKRLINIENHIFGHSTNFYEVSFLHKFLKIAMLLMNSLLTRLLARSIL